MWDENVHALLDLLPVGVLVIDPAGKLETANRPGLEFLGIDERAKERPDLAGLIENDALRHAVSPPGNGIVRMNVSDGARTYHAEIRSLPVPPEGRRLLIVRDVTGLANVSRLRRSFVYDLLHKVRTPLTTIVSVLRMVTSGRLDPNRVDVGEVLSMGAVEADRLTGLLGRLKDLFLIESGALEDEVSPEPVDVKTILSDLVREAVRAPAGETLPPIDERYPEGAALALADPEILPRAVAPVLANALAYAPADRPVRVGVERDGEEVRILFEDEGPGVSEEELPRVFDRFFRGSAPEVREVEGEGLGLYLARHLLLVQGGTILLDSRPGEGVRVEISLPAAEEEA